MEIYKLNTVKESNVYAVRVEGSDLAMLDAKIKENEQEAYLQRVTNPLLIIKSDLPDLPEGKLIPIKGDWRLVESVKLGLILT